MECPKCHKLKFGELQSFCKHCGFSDGGDRWFAESDEEVPLKLLTE